MTIKKKNNFKFLKLIPIESELHLDFETQPTTNLMQNVHGNDNYEIILKL